MHNPTSSSQREEASLRAPLLWENGSSAPETQPPKVVEGRRVSDGWAHPAGGQANSGIIASEAQDTALESAWQDCILLQCCGKAANTTTPLSVRPAAGITPATSTHHHTSVVRPEKEVEAAPPGPPLSLPLNVDLSTPQGQLLGQLAGGVWMTQVLALLWPHMSKAVAAAVQDMIPQLVELNKPGWLQDVTLDAFSLGPHPPVVRSVHVDNINDDTVAEARMRLEVSWDSQSDIQLTVKLLPSSVQRKLPRLLSSALDYMSSLTAGVQHLAVKAHVLVSLGPLTDTLPVIKQVQVSLLRTPDIDFNITITKGESKILNLVKPWLRSTIAAAFGPLILPEHVSMPLEPGAPADIHKPEGVLLVQIVKATNMPKMDIIGHCDTYVDVWVRGRIKYRTPTIKNNPNPAWPKENATFKFLVHNRQYQFLSFELWDEDAEMFNRIDDNVGVASLALTDLQPGQEKMVELRVINTSTAGAYAEEAPPGVDPAHASGTSTADVSNTKLFVNVKYIAANDAALLPQEVGCPGTLTLNIAQVTVPDLTILPVRIRPYVTGQKLPLRPALSHPLKRLTGTDPRTGEDRKDKRTIPLNYSTVWDVFGSATQVAMSVFVLEAVMDAGLKSELVVARAEIPLVSIAQRKILDVPGGIAGGKYVLHTDTGFSFEAEIVWNPLLDDAGEALSVATAVAETSQGVGLQQILDPTPFPGINSSGIATSAAAAGSAPQQDIHQTAANAAAASLQSIAPGGGGGGAAGCGGNASQRPTTPMGQATQQQQQEHGSAPSVETMLDEFAKSSVLTDPTAVAGSSMRHRTTGGGGGGVDASPAGVM